MKDQRKLMIGIAIVIILVMVMIALVFILMQDKDNRTDEQIIKEQIEIELSENPFLEGYSVDDYYELLKISGTLELLEESDLIDDIRDGKLNLGEAIEKASREEVDKSISSARNTLRENNVAQILNALTQYITVEGSLPNDVDELIPTCDETVDIGPSGVDLESLLVDQYIVSIPTDPVADPEFTSGYTICVTETGRYTISAPLADNFEEISITL